MPNHKYYSQNKELCKKRNVLWAKNNPVKHRMIKVLSAIKNRCRNIKNPSYKNYGGRGIKCFLTLKDLLILWKKNRAYKIKNPCIDRINNDGDYEVSNCQLLSRRDSTLKQWGECRSKLLKAQQAAIVRGDWGKMKHKV